MRLCRAKGIKAIFHRWSETSYVIPPSPMIGGHNGGTIQYATAIVEYKNGQITEVVANDVVFFDTKEVMEKLQEVEPCNMN